MATPGGLVKLVVSLALSSCAGLAVVGCKKSDSDSGSNGSTVVSVPPLDLTPVGTITDAGLQKIASHSGEKRLTIVFVRAPLSDAGLNQLAKFPNVRRVDAVGSKVTDAGVEKLKSAIPEVEVVK